MGYCGQCGQPIDGPFCGSCGAKADPQPVAESPPAAEPDEWKAVAAVPAWADSSRRSRRIPVIVTVVALAVAAGGLGAFYFLNRTGEETPAAAASVSSTPPPTADSAPTGSSSTTSSTTSSTSSSSTSPTSPTSESQAVTMLNELADKGEKQVPIDNKYLISLSLKWVGIEDDSQQTDPFTAMDIWNHFQGIIEDPRFRGDVKIVRDGHFGNQLSAGQGGRGRAWVAVIDPNLATEKAGIAWCEANFTERGEELANLCHPRKASPPHD